MLGKWFTRERGEGLKLLFTTSRFQRCKIFLNIRELLCTRKLCILNVGKSSVTIYIIHPSVDFQFSSNIYIVEIYLYLI